MKDKLLLPDGEIVDDCDRTALVKQLPPSTRRRRRFMMIFLELVVWLILMGIAVWLLLPFAVWLL